MSMVRDKVPRSGLPLELGLLPSRSSFLTWHRRPKLLDEAYSAGEGSYENFGIVVQGPVLRKHEFTFQTLLSYRRMFPGARVVLSTWESQGVTAQWRDTFGEAGIQLVESPQPQEKGHSNFNLQLKSSIAGLAALQEYGVEFAVKQRTDQRIYNKFALSYLEASLKLIKARDGNARLFSSSLNSFLGRPYGLSDMFQFSTLEEVTRYWSVPQAVGPHRYPNPGGHNFNESFLAFNYCASRTKSGTPPDWEEALSEFFGIVDHSTLDMYWPKYSRREYLWRRYAESELEELTHSRWLSIVAKYDEDRSRWRPDKV